MKNVIEIDATKDCECVGIFNIDADNNSLYASIYVDNDATTPELEIYMGSSLYSTTSLVAGKNEIIIPTDAWNLGSYSSIKYKDENYTGSSIQFNFPSTVDYDMILKSTSTANVFDIACNTPPYTPKIVDNLMSTSAIDALSANQGKILNDLISAINSSLESYSTAFNTFIGQFIVGSTVKVITQADSSVAIYTLDGIASKFPVAFVCNGDNNANKAHVIGASIRPSTGQIFALLDPNYNVAGNIRINYLIFVPANVSPISDEETTEEVSVVNE